MFHSLRPVASAFGLMACSLILPLAAHAGKYIATYSYSFTPPAGTSGQTSATNTAAAPGFAQVAYGSGSMTLSVTPSLVWTPDARGDTSTGPPNVSFVEVANISMQIRDVSNPPAGVNVTAQTASDGIGDTVTHPASPGYGVLCTDYKPTSNGSPGAQTARTITSNFAYTTQDVISSGGGAVNYTLYPIYITLAGQDLATGNALTGQQIQATLVSNLPPGTKITSYTWSFTGGTKGNPIKDWQGTNNKIQLVPLAPADLSQTDTSGNGIAVQPISFYDEVADIKVTAKCAVNLTFPDGTTGSVTATSAPVTFMKPTVTWTVGQSYNKIVPGFFTDYPGQMFGVNELWGKIVIKEPSALVKNGPGYGCVVQVATLNRSLTRTPLNGQPATYNKLRVLNGDGTTGMIVAPTGLDGAFPYPFGSTANADGTFTQTTSNYTWPANTDGYSGDRPTQFFTTQSQDTGGNQWYSSTANDNFNTWVMYRPPANGLGTIYVPLQTLNWSWGGNASLTANVWSVSQGPPFTPGMPADTPTPPSWGLQIPVGLVIGP